MVEELTVDEPNNVKLTNDHFQTKALSIHERIGNTSKCQYKKGWIWQFKQRCRMKVMIKKERKCLNDHRL